MVEYADKLDRKQSKHMNQNAYLTNKSANKLNNHECKQHQTFPCFNPKVQLKALSSDVVQQRTFIDESGYIEQYEKKGTPWTAVGKGEVKKRSSELTQKVEQFKKEILTLIAQEMKFNAKSGHIRNTPHISVVLQGTTCNIAINSLAKGDEARKNAKTELIELATKTMKDLNEAFGSFKENHTNNPDLANSLETDEKVEAEALYIALRWAAKAQSINVQDIPKQTDSSGSVHGEMSILKNEYNETTSRTGWKRPLRVGGTKTPCFDCGEVMGVHDGLSDSNHIPHSDKKFVEKNGQSRRVWTMTTSFGKGFKNWKDPELDSKRPDMLEPDSDTDGYDDKQDQSTDNIMLAILKYT